MTPKKVLVLPDTHITAVDADATFDKRAWKAVRQYIADHAGEWDVIVHLGDLLDLPQLAVFNKNTELESRELQPDFDLGKRFLEEVREAAGGSPKLILIEGNHDVRFKKWMSKNPNLKKFVSYEEKLGLRDLGWEFVPYYQAEKTYNIGPVSFGHGVKVSANHAKDHITLYGTNFFYGHLHTTQQAVSRTVFGGNLIAQSLGCLCTHKPYYLIGLGNNHQQAFGVFYICPARFNHYCIHINGGKFITPEGKEYGRK